MAFLAERIVNNEHFRVVAYIRYLILEGVNGEIARIAFFLAFTSLKIKSFIALGATGSCCALVTGFVTFRTIGASILKVPNLAVFLAGFGSR